MATVFFDAATATFRGEFIGFMQSLQFDSKLDSSILKRIKFRPKAHFEALGFRKGKLEPRTESIFLWRYPIEE